MLIPGLVSISFRSRTAEELISECVRLGLKTVEWGGDVHVPHGDEKRAGEVAGRMAEAGLTTAAYGSYFRAGNENQPDFGGIIACARILHAPTIRVWAGSQGSEECTNRKPVWSCLKECCRMAAGHGLTLTLECHNKTLTDTVESTLQLLEEVDHPALRCGWQPQFKRTEACRMDWLRKVLPWLSTVHAFSWTGNGHRLALAENAAEWIRFLSILRERTQDIPVMLEFVKDDTLEQLADDAETLKKLLA